MYILVIGCGKVGYHLTKALMAIGHEVTVIERDPQRCESLRDELGSIALQGDGTEVQLLRKAGASRADVVIAVATRDEDNLATCQIARHIFEKPKTMAQLKDPQNEAIFKLLGVDVAINSTHMILANIEEEIPGHPLVHLMNLTRNETGSQMEMVSINVPSDAAVVGKSLSDVELPPNSFVSLVVQHGGPMLPSEDLVLGPGDDVVAAASPDEVQILFETLTGVE